MTILDKVSRLTPEERTIFFQSQQILVHEQHVSRLLVDGILGRHFSRPLSFYLTAYPRYLASLEKESHASVKP
jgi:hypothetical protein